MGTAPCWCGQRTDRAQNESPSPGPPLAGDQRLGCVEREPWTQGGAARSGTEAGALPPGRPPLSPGLGRGSLPGAPAEGWDRILVDGGLVPSGGGAVTGQMGRKILTEWEVTDRSSGKLPSHPPSHLTAGTLGGQTPPWTQRGERGNAGPAWPGPRLLLRTRCPHHSSSVNGLAFPPIHNPQAWERAVGGHSASRSRPCSCCPG